MTTKSKTRDERKELHPLSKIERARIIDALRFARMETRAMRPMLNLAEAATLDMFRRLRQADHDAAPSVSRLAEYLGWTRSATVEQLEALKRKGFIKRAQDCSLYIETIEAVALKCSSSLVAMAVALATSDPGNTQAFSQIASVHHANAVEICHKIALLVPSGLVIVSKDVGKASFYGPIIPIIHDVRPINTDCPRKVA